MIRLVCFDLGRVLIRICDDWDHACRVVGIHRTSSFDKVDEATDRAFWRSVQRYDTGQIDLQAFAQEVAPLHGLRPQDVIELQNAYLRGPYPGVDQLLDDLQPTGVLTACLSNTTDSHWQQMHDRTGRNFLPLQRLNFRFASHLIGARKPEPAIYEHVERATGVAASNIIFFDDAPENVESAAKRGWHAQLIRRDTDPIRQVRAHLLRLGILT